MTTRNDLLCCLRILTYREWPELPGEWLLPAQKEKELNLAHFNALRRIGINLISDPEAQAFVQKVNAAIPEPYTVPETLAAAEELAPRFLARLMREEKKKETESGYSKRIQEMAEYDPFMGEDSQVQIEGLYHTTPLKTRFNPESGAIDTLEDEKEAPHCIGPRSAKPGDEVLVHSRR